jgi:hypothetical protein
MNYTARVRGFQRPDRSACIRLQIWCRHKPTLPRGWGRELIGVCNQAWPTRLEACGYLRRFSPAGVGGKGVLVECGVTVGDFQTGGKVPSSCGNFHEFRDRRVQSEFWRVPLRAKRIPLRVRKGADGGG